jgi:hypothetical protein
MMMASTNNFLVYKSAKSEAGGGLKKNSQQ